MFTGSCFVVLALVCYTCRSQGQMIQMTSRQMQSDVASSPLQSLAMMLLTSNPASSFTSAGQFAVRGRTNAAAKNRQSQPAMAASTETFKDFGDVPVVAPRRVVVTGLGMVTPLGNDVDSTWKAVLEGKTG